MLKRENRIRAKKDFAEIKEKGRIQHSPFFAVLKSNEEDDLKKIGIIVSKKISKRAVDRNKIRRQISQVIRKNIKEIKAGSRLLFLTKKEILGKKMKEIEKEVESFIK